MTAVELFEQTLSWLRDNYTNFTFFAERDVVWTIQTHILKLIEEQHLPYKIFNDHPMISGKHRSLSTDLAIVDPRGCVQVAAEFKYEPSHSRGDIPQAKFPVVFWGDDGIGKDLARIRAFVTVGKARFAYSVLIDEGGYFRKRDPHPGSEWIDWGNDVWVLYSKVVANP